MKKQWFLLSICLLFSLHGIAQFELVKDSLDQPTAITFHENRAFVSLQGAQPNTGKIISFELDNPEETCITHAENLSQYPRSIIAIDNNLYIGFTTYIGKVDLSQSSFEITEFTSNVFFPRCLIVQDNKLYVAEDGRISFVDLASQNAPAIPLIENLASRPLSITIKNDALFFTSENNIHQVDLTDPSLEINDLATDLALDVYSITTIGNDLYFDQTFNASGEKTIMKLSLSDPENTMEDVVSGIGSAIHLNHKNGIMYFASPLNAVGSVDGNIYKFSEAITTNNEWTNPIIYQLYPNPAKDFIAIKGLEDQHYKFKVFNQNGQLVNKLSNQSRMDIQALNHGLYFIEIRNTENQVLFQSKFVK